MVDIFTSDSEELQGFKLPVREPENLSELDNTPASVLDTLRSTMWKYNAAYSLANTPVELGGYDKDINFDLDYYIESNNINRDLYPVLADVRNEKEADDVIKAFMKTLDADQKIATRPVLGTIFGLASGITSPEVLVPVIGWLPKVKGAAKFASTIGQGAALGAGSIYVGEKALQKAHGFRSEEEIQQNTIIGLVAGGIAGGFAAKAPKAMASIKEDLSDLVKNKIKTMNEGSVGAAKVVDYATLVKEANPKALPQWAVKGLSLTRMPIFRGLATKYRESKDLARRMFASPLEYEKPLVGPSAEALLKVDLQEITDSVGKVNKSVQNLQGVTKGIFRNERTALKQSTQDILEEAGKLYIKGGRHQLDEMNKIVQEFEKIANKAQTRLKEAGLLSEENIAKTLETSGARYRPRVYNVERIQENFDEFVEDIAAKLRTKNKNITEQESRTFASEFYDHVLNLKEGDFEDLQSLGANMFSRPQSKPAFLKERNMELSDLELEPWLVNDISVILPYANQAHRLARAQEMLESLGAKNIADFKKIIRLRHDENAIQLGLTKKDLDQALKFADDAIETFTGRARKSGDFDAHLRVLQNMTAMASLGMLTVSSAPDAWMMAFKHGPLAGIRDGILPIIRSLTKHAKKDSLADLNDTIYGLDSAMEGYIGYMLDPTNSPLLHRSKIETGSEVAAGAFSKTIGFNSYNSNMRYGASQATISNMIRRIKRNNPRDQHKLANLGFTDKDKAIILDQFNRYGETKRGAFITNHKKWGKSDNFSKEEVMATRERFRAALVTDVDSTNLVPGMGDIPFKMQNEQFYKAWGMFKSFIFTATHRIAISSINRHDKEALIGLTGLTALGAFSYATKELVKGRDPDTSVDNLLFEGIARSGITGILGEPLFNVLGRGRYAEQSMSQFLLGPIGASAVNMGVVGGKVLEGDVSDSDLRKLRRMMILQNHPGIQLLERIYEKDK